MVSVFLLHAFSLLTVFCSSYSTATSLVLSLSRSPMNVEKQQELTRLAVASSYRVQTLKNPKSANVDDIPVSLRGYGAYTVSLSFGTPPQTLSLVMDTASSLVWLPCTKNYSCIDCDFKGGRDWKVFQPDLSNSARSDDICNATEYKHLIRFIPDLPKPTDCGPYSQFQAYTLQYVTGKTTGVYAFETLSFPNKTPVLDFLHGCSLSSYSFPSGIAGFGPERTSLPAQMGLDSFSYCMATQVFNAKGSSVTGSGNLVLTKGGAKSEVPGITYTPFISLPKGTKYYQQYYYIWLKNITVGEVGVKVPKGVQLPDSNGDGGTIVDSGTTFTAMEGSTLKLVVDEFERSVGNHYTRDVKAENTTGLALCYDVSGDVSLKYIPKFSFTFQGGAVMDFPMENYFTMVDGSVACLLMVSSSPVDAPLKGTAMTVGNYMQQNFYVEYDLKENRFGFLQKQCK